MFNLNLIRGFLWVHLLQRVLWCNFAFLFLSHYTLRVFMYICILCRVFSPYGVMFVSPLQVVLSTCFESSSPYPLGSKVHGDVVVGLPFRVVFTFGIASRPCLDP